MPYRNIKGLGGVISYVHIYGNRKASIPLCLYLCTPYLPNRCTIFLINRIIPQLIRETEHNRKH